MKCRATFVAEESDLRGERRIFPAVFNDHEAYAGDYIFIRCPLCGEERKVDKAESWHPPGQPRPWWHQPALPHDVVDMLKSTGRWQDTVPPGWRD
jgi:hypothetical protein